MFERYTEKARRVIFFARYEASQFGSPYIETEHLLLGLLRDSRVVVGKMLPQTTYESLRRKIESRTSPGNQIPTTVDLPLSNESKRVLAYAAEEAERLAHRHIGAEHLLLGLLRENKSLATELLNEEGLTLERARDEIGTQPADPSVGPEPWSAGQVEVHGRILGREYVKGVVNGLKDFAWFRREWRPVDLVIDKEQGGICFDLSVADGKRFVLQPGGWAEEPCAICGWMLQAGSSAERSEGFTNGRRWICVECYDKFVAIT